MRTGEAGFTLPEVLISLVVLSLVSIGMYTIMFSSTRNADVAEAVTDVSAEARFGINRMLRETREADSLLCTPACPTATSYSIAVDYDQNGVYGTPNPDGTHEIVTFEYDAAGRRILIRAGAQMETLIAGVEQVAGRDIFTYWSNRLEYDTNGDGRVTWQEIDQTAGLGNTNSTLDDPELGYVTNVGYALRVTSGTRSGEFLAEAQLRNRR